MIRSVLIVALLMRVVDVYKVVKGDTPLKEVANGAHFRRIG